MRLTIPGPSRRPAGERSRPGVPPHSPAAPPDRPRTVAHRGASHDQPENTLAAIRRAVELGADAVEVDVRRTRDGALVLLHDATLERTTDARRVFPQRAPWRVADFTHDELVGLDAGSWKTERHAGQRVPTLDEALEVLAGSGTALLLELKEPHLYPGIVRDVVAGLRQRPEHACSGAGAVVQSFHHPAMKELKRLAPEIPVGLLGAPSWADLPALATWADQVNPGHLSADRAYVDRLHRLGLQCQVWTVNRPPAMRRALRMGVDGVITNRPDVLRRVLAARCVPAATGARVVEGSLA